MTTQTELKPEVGATKDPKTVKSMFAKVAGRYDLANQVLSLGIHHWWRRFLVDQARLKGSEKILDCATGTGDLAIEWAKALRKAGSAQVQVVGVDFCAPMLEHAPQKAHEAGFEIEFKVADVMALPFADSTFDIVSISFGVRNLSDRKKGILEMLRVLKPGGRLCILEFGQPESKIFGELYNFYSQKILPKLGGLLTGAPAAYDYLQESSAVFPSGDDFLNEIKSLDSKLSLQYWPLTFGISYLYEVKKP